MPDCDRSTRVVCDSSRSEGNVDVGLICLTCGNDMGEIRTITRPDVLSEIHVFQCPSCHSILAFSRKVYPPSR
jgi:hypothetical protein